MSKEIEDLGVLDLKGTKIFAGALPKGTEKVIVSYKLGRGTHNWDNKNIAHRVSCVVGPHTHKVSTRYDGQGYRRAVARETFTGHELEVPHILVSIDYYQTPMLGSRTGVSNVVGRSYIYAFNSKSKANIWAAPYMLGNVYSDGSICLGNNPQPASLRQLYNTFFCSSFTGSLLNAHTQLSEFSTGSVNSASVSEHLKNYQEQVLDAQDWYDYTPEICGEEFWATPEGAEVLLLTKNRRLLKAVPSKYWTRTKDKIFIVALGNKVEGGWEFTSGAFKFGLPDKNITLNGQQSDKVTLLKRKFGNAKLNFRKDEPKVEAVAEVVVAEVEAVAEVAEVVKVSEAAKEALVGEIDGD